jgi:hypothetical protein
MRATETSAMSPSNFPTAKAIADGMAALMADLISGRISVQTANATCRTAGAKLAQVQVVSRCAQMCRRATKREQKRAR